MPLDPTQLSDADKALLAEVEAKIIEKNAKAEGKDVTPPAQPQPIKVNLNGQVLEFASQDELNKKFAEYDAQAREAAELKARYDASQGRVQTTVEQPKVEDSKLDINKFIEKLATDPVAAFDMVDELRYGFKDAPKVIRTGLERTIASERELTANAFRDRHPEFVGNDSNAQALMGVMNQLGIPWTPQGLEAAYSVARLNGLLEIDTEIDPYDKSQTQQKEEVSPYAAEFNQNAPPPRVTRSATSAQDASRTANLLQQAESLSADELGDLIRKYEGGR